MLDLLVPIFLLAISFGNEPETTLRLESYSTLRTEVSDVQIFCMTPNCKDYRRPLFVDSYLCEQDGLEANTSTAKNCLKLTGNHTIIFLKLHPGKYQVDRHQHHSGGLKTIGNPVTFELYRGLSYRYKVGQPRPELLSSRPARLDDIPLVHGLRTK